MAPSASTESGNLRFFGLVALGLKRMIIRHPPWSTNLLHAFVQLLSCEQGSPCRDPLHSTRDPEFPRKRVPVLADAPAYWSSHCTAKTTPEPLFFLCCFANLIIKQEVFKAAPQPAQFLSLQPRKYISAERQISPLFKRLRLVQA